MLSIIKMECHNEYKTYTALTSCGNGYKALAGFLKQYCKCEVLTLMTDHSEMGPKFDQTTSCCLLLQKYKLKKKKVVTMTTHLIWQVHLFALYCPIILSLLFIKLLAWP